MKSALAAGFVYGLSKKGITHFDIALGVSSSVGTAAAVTTGQFEDLRSVWREQLTKGNFISLKRFFAGDPIFDLDWLVYEVFCKRHEMTVEKLIHSQTTFMTCGYNFKTNTIDFWTSKDSDFKDIVWKSMKAAMTLHPKEGEWIRGYEHTDADLMLYHLYKNIPVTSEFRTLIVSNHYNQTYTFRKRVGNWLFRFFQSSTFPKEVKQALRNRATIQKEGLELISNFIKNTGAVMYKPPKNLRLPFWSVVTSQSWLMRYYFDQGEKQAEGFIKNPNNTPLVNALKERAAYLASKEFSNKG